MSYRMVSAAPRPSCGPAPLTASSRGPVTHARRTPGWAPKTGHVACRAGPTSSVEPLIVVDGISKSHDGMKQLFSGLSFNLSRSDRIAIIGANGSGKTSLLKLLSGADWPDDGDIVRKKNLKIGFLQQSAELAENCSAIDAVVQADSPIAACVRNYNRLVAQGVKANGEAMEKALDEMNALGAWELEDKAVSVLEQVGIPDPNMSVDKMSGGQRRKVTVAAALLGQPDVLILDEPTNHMDVQFMTWMEKTILEEQTTLVLVTHDRHFLECTCTQILELDHGLGYLHPVGGPGSYLEYQLRRQARRDAQASAAQDAKVVLRKETEWMAKQPRARQAKSKSRQDAFHVLTGKAKAGPKKDQKISFGDVKMARQGKKVLIMKECSKAWDGKPIIEDFTYEFSPGERIGIVGPNGAGKSSLLDLIAGGSPLDSGDRQVGDTTVLGYFAQHPPDVDPKLRIIDYVSSIAEKSDQDRELMGSATASWSGVGPDKLLEQVGFPYAKQRQLVASLSGGERRRLHLASILASKPNFLILDEPTNDLDLNTIETLEMLLEEYPGCVLVVSHDKAFMERATDRMFVLEGDGVVRLFNGDYVDYLDYMKQKVQKAKQDKAAAERKSKADAAAARIAAETPVQLAAPVKHVVQLGFREKQELGKLEKQVEKLEGDKEKLEAEIAAMAQGGDFTKVNKLTAQLSQLTNKLDYATDKWMALAERAEATAV